MPIFQNLSITHKKSYKITTHQSSNPVYDIRNFKLQLSQDWNEVRQRRYNKIRMRRRNSSFWSLHTHTNKKRLRIQFKAKPDPNTKANGKLSNQQR